MKIGKKELKKIILSELADLVAGVHDPIGVENDFETHAFTTHVEAIQGNLGQMEKVIRENEGLDRKSLLFFKERAIGDLYQAISFVEGAIDDRLKKLK